MNREQFELILPKKIIFGAGSIESVGIEVKNLDCKKYR